MGKIADLVGKMLGDGMPPAAIIAAVRAAEDGQRRSIHIEFAQFWAAYPAPIAKGAAEKAYEKARTLASAEEILDAVQRYAAKRDDRPWCHPSTWLNQRRWEDQVPQPIVPAKGLAGVRARLTQEIENEQQYRSQELGGDVGGGLPQLSLFSH